MRSITFPLLIIYFVWGCSPYPVGQETHGSVPVADLRQYPKNVILMIGNGMGLTQITAGMYINNNQLNLENFPVVGLHKAYSAKRLISDSAAGATALATGVKTNLGALGVDQDSMPLRSILEEAEERGLATGLVTTSAIVRAIPAAFVAHMGTRDRFEEIAEVFLNTEVDFVVGGGKKYFDDRRRDERNLYEELRQHNYVVSDFSRKPLKEVKLKYDRNFAYFTAELDPPPAMKGRDYLPAASKMAPRFLSRRSTKGFFLMIESAQIDWAGHANNSDWIISEMIDFDKAIGEVLEFARADGETLVIVTAAHETGGYTINIGSRMDSLATEFTTSQHTASLIPVFAFGPGAELFAGIYENTEIHKKMHFALGFDQPAD